MIKLDEKNDKYLTKALTGVIGILILMLVWVLFRCDGKVKDYKYAIHGSVTNKLNKYQHPAIWYTDTFTISGDTAFYYNSDSSKVIITEPYTIYTRH